MDAVVALAGAWALICGIGAWRHPLSVRQSVGVDWERELAGALARDDDAAKVVAINEALADVEHRIERDMRWPLAMGWMIVAGCAIAALWLALELRWRGLGQVLALGALGVAGCVAARRAGRRWAESARRDADARAGRLAGALYDAEVVLAGRRRPRRRTSRGLGRLQS